MYDEPTAFERAAFQMGHDDSEPQDPNDFEAVIRNGLTGMTLPKSLGELKHGAIADAYSQGVSWRKYRPELTTGQCEAVWVMDVRSGDSGRFG